MAFDRPLEADRVDNLGLLSSFVRAPLVAPIMWAIGGLLPEEKENTVASLTTNNTTEQQQQQQQQKLPENNLSPLASGNEATGQSYEIKPHEETIDILIETSNQMTSTSNSSLRRNSAKFEGLSTFKYQGDDLNEDIQSTTSWYTKKNRKTSWSDESGQDLVQYCNESSKNHGETEGNLGAVQVASKDGTTHPKKPMKSAMRKGSRRHNPSRCIPSMPPSVKGGCTASANNKSGGYISPQWGWYISTTPPTPEYYAAGSQRHPVLSHQMMNTNNANLVNQVTQNQYGTIGKQHEWVPCASSTTTTVQDSSSPKPLFNKGPLKYSSGWPTVPL